MGGERRSRCTVEARPVMEKIKRRKGKGSDDRSVVGRAAWRLATSNSNASNYKLQRDNGVRGVLRALCAITELEANARAFSPAIRHAT